MWDAILEAGAEHGIRPFGLEPQRILRLQKMHILVGQDTDSESTPYGAAMPWIVKLDKDEDFIGKWALEHAAEHAGRDRALVGFTLPDGDVPTEGAAVLDARGEPDRPGHERAPLAPARAASSAWPGCRPRMASDGAAITISDDEPPAARRGHDQAVLRPRRRGAALVSGFEFLEPTGAAVARSPMEGQALAAGARMELRDGWNVAVAYPGAARA